MFLEVNFFIVKNILLKIVQILKKWLVLERVNYEVSISVFLGKIRLRMVIGVFLLFSVSVCGVVKGWVCFLVVF